MAELRSLTGLPEEQCLHLSEAYGTAAIEPARLISEQPDLGQRISEFGPWTLAEIPYTVRNEMCITVQDFLMRRTQMRFVETQGTEAAELVAREIGKLLGWNSALVESQAAGYMEYIRQVWTP